MKIEYRGAVALLRMQAGKANAFSRSFMTALEGALNELNERPINCLIMTGYEKNFSAGLNLLELRDYDRAQMTQFLEQFASLFMRLMQLPQVLIAAINGNAIAGGAILAQLADYRVMARTDARIGVIEINLGIPFPRQVLEILKQRLPRATHFEAIYRGRLFTPDEALRFGLIDELCELSALEERSFAIAEEMAAKSGAALACIKRDLSTFDMERLEMLGRLGDNDFIDIWFSDDARSKIGAVVESLQAKKRS